MLAGYWTNNFTHVPIPLAASESKKIDPAGKLWSEVLSCTGQPKKMGHDTFSYFSLTYKLPLFILAGLDNRCHFFDQSEKQKEEL